MTTGKLTPDLLPGDVVRVKGDVFYEQAGSFGYTESLRGGTELVVISPVGLRWQLEDVHERQWTLWAEDLEGTDPEEEV